MSFLDKITAQLPFKPKTEDSEYFLALNIGLTEVTAAVWAIFGKEVDILGTATFAYSDHEDLLEKSLQAFDKALGVLEIEPQKVLFGVPDSWSLDDNLKEPYLKLLRKILKECDLEALAFVTTTNALSFALQKGEGAPPTVILFGVGESLEATLIRGGKIAETRSAKRTDHLFDDVEKVLSQFTEVEVLPSRILLYSTKKEENLNKIHDDLMSYPWVSKLPFLHFPKIDILEEEAPLRAIISSAAFELNPEVDLKHSFVSKQEAAAPASGPKALHPAKPMLSRAKAVAPDEDLGFVKGDIRDRNKSDEIGESVDQFAGELDEVRKEDEMVGMEEEMEALDEDELMEPKVAEGDRYSEEEMHLPVSSHRDANLVAPEGMEGKHHMGGKNSPVSSILNKASVALGPVMPFVEKIQGSAAGKLVLIPVFLLVVVLAYVFLVKANVTIFVEPKILEKDTQVIADPKATSVDEEKKIIPGTTVETTVDGSGKGSATGSKQIGDPAKGKVTLYNMTNSSVSLSQGTTLTANNGLKFTLDSSAKIASQSSTLGADLTTVIKPGKTESVGITAAAIGPDSNLPASSDTNNGLSVSGYSKSQVTAMITDALSGGTSKTVTVVTSDDQKKLQAQVLDDLRTKAVEALKGKLSGDKKIISEGLSIVDAKYSYSKQVNDAASEFSLNATVRFKGTAYSDNDLRSIVGKLVETNVPDGYQLDLQDTETQADITKVEKDGRLVFTARFKAKMMPKYDLAQIKKDIRGKSFAEVADRLKSLNNAIGSDIELSPSLPSKFARIPFLDQNININVAPK